MAEDSSTSLLQESNLLSSDSSITHETIDSQLPQNQETHRSTSPNSMNPNNPLEQNQNVPSNNEPHTTNFSNFHAPIEYLTQIEATDESKFKENKETDGRKPKRVRKRGKGSKKHSNSNGDLVEDFERQSVCDCDKRGGRSRVAYSREEMEALRCMDLDEQKKKWVEVYCGLGPVVAKEYDDLVGARRDDEGNFVNFDPRNQFSEKSADVLGKESGNLGGESADTNHLDHVSGVNNGDVECSEDDDSDEECISIQRPAFFVTGEPDFDSGPPQDGLEYLRRVRWEAEHIPKVKVAKVETSKLNKEQTVYMPKIPDIVPCPEHLMPSKEWEDVFLADFSDLRLALSQEQSSTPFSAKISQTILETSIQENLDRDSPEVKNDLSNITEPDTPRSSSSTPKSPSKSDDWPLLRAVVGMEPVARVSALRLRIKDFDSMSSVTQNDCAWLFALCAAIDTPLDADTSAWIRCLLRKCASLRAEKPELDDEVVMLNVLATIAGKYFGQSEI